MHRVKQVGSDSVVYMLGVVLGYSLVIYSYIQVH